jgi:hypothetical protein
MQWQIKESSPKELIRASHYFDYKGIYIEDCVKEMRVEYYIPEFVKTYFERFSYLYSYKEFSELIAIIIRVNESLFDKFLE